MKKLSRVFALIMALAMCISMFSLAQYVDTQALTYIKYDQPIYLDKQEKALTAYTNMIDSFESSSYPSYYGGAYLDNDKNLVILTKNASQAEKQILKNKLNYDGKLLFKDANFSYNDMINLMKEIEKVNIPSRSLDANNNGKVIYLSFREDENKIYVGLANNSLSSQKIFSTNLLQHISSLNQFNIQIDDEFSKQSSEKLITDVLPIQFCQADPIEEEASLMPGNYISVGPEGAYIRERASVGFYGSIIHNGVKKYGIFTAAHAAKNIGDTARVESTQGPIYGSTIVREYSSRVDVAFIQKNGNISFVNLIDGQPVRANYSYYPLVGTTVKKAGTETRITTGTVISTNGVCVDSSGNRFYNMIEADYNSGRGDSGGLVYVKGSTNVVAVGIHKGTLANETGTPHAYSSKVKYLSWSATPEMP